MDLKERLKEATECRNQIRSDDYNLGFWEGQMKVLKELIKDEEPDPEFIIHHCNECGKDWECSFKTCPLPTVKNVHCTCCVIHGYKR